MIGLTLGCIAAISCFGAQAGPKPMTPNPNVRKVCLEGIDVRVGDAFEKVEAKLTLAPDPAEGEAVYLSAKGPERDVAGGTLSSSMRLTFDGRRRLRSLTILWTYDGERSEAARERLLAALVDEVHPCFKKHSLAETYPGRRETTIQYGTYSEKLVFDEGDEWRIAYTISEEP